MPFERATPVPVRLKAGFYGLPGSGKTYTSLLLAEALAEAQGKRVAFIDTENGTRFYRRERPQDPIHPKPFDFDVIETKSIAVTLHELRNLDTEKYGVFIIDSISHIWDACMEAVERRTSAGTIEMRDWGKVKAPFKELMRLGLDMPVDFFILGRQKNIFEESGGDLKKVGEGMRAENEAGHEPDLVLKFKSVKNPKVPTVSAIQAYVEKDRSSCFSGQVLTNPSVETFHPLLEMLGAEHTAFGETEAERQAADDEMVIKREADIREKEKKSAAAAEEFKERMRAAEPHDLAAIVAEVKKSRKVMAKHKDKLRQFYNTLVTKESI